MAEAAVRTTLATAERGRVWRSNRNQANYRWNDALGTWEVETSVADYHPVRPGGDVRTVYAQAGEKFYEVAQ